MLALAEGPTAQAEASDPQGCPCFGAQHAACALGSRGGSQNWGTFPANRLVKRMELRNWRWRGGRARWGCDLPRPPAPQNVHLLTRPGAPQTPPSRISVDVTGTWLVTLLGTRSPAAPLPAGGVIGEWGCIAGSPLLATSPPWVWSESPLISITRDALSTPMAGNFRGSSEPCARTRTKTKYMSVIMDHITMHSAT